MTLILRRRMFSNGAQRRQRFRHGFVIPWITRNLIVPLHERLVGRKTLRAVRALRQSQWFAPRETRSLQQHKLAALLRHAAANVPFYRDRIGRAALSPEADPLKELTKLPLLDKRTIRASLRDMVWPEAPGGVLPCSTGGSTGEPLRFYVDRNRQAYDQAARIRSHEWFGLRLGDSELYLWGSPIETNAAARLKKLRDKLFNHGLLSAFEMSPARMDAYLDVWERFQPRSLFGYPSSIALLVRHAQSRDRRLSTKRLRAVFVTGEICLPEDRTAMERFFGVPVADGYGSREAGFIAHQCPQGAMHVTAESVVVEIVQGDKPVPPGEAGEIVITHLDALAMPLIRYRTGDVGRLLPGRCRCGRGLPLMDVVQGRTTDFLYLPDGTAKHALSVIYPLRDLPGINAFRVSQDADYGLEVAVVRETPKAPECLKAVERAVRQVVGADLRIRIREVDRIPATLSGKYRYVESRVRCEQAPLLQAAGPDSGTAQAYL